MLGTSNRKGGATMAEALWLIPAVVVALSLGLWVVSRLIPGTRTGSRDGDGDGATQSRR
jgi:hypothetical protein